MEYDKLNCFISGVLSLQMVGDTARLWTWGVKKFLDLYLILLKKKREYLININIFISSFCYLFN